MNPYAYALVINTETESEVIADNHTPQLARGRQKTNRHFLWCGVSGRRLYSHRLLMPASVNRLQKVSLDTTGCLEDGKWRQSISSDVVG
ncbi:hypothetical protein TNCV_3998131 [Trichonephila clavipes]|nr:hypothetical protein TNCV_3998131 [Trichonephila clavipes]